MIRRVPVGPVALAAVVLAGLAASARSEAGPSPLLGFADSKLVRVNSDLQPLSGPAIPAGSGGCAARQGGTACWAVPPWTVSPDSTRLAIARNGFSSLRVVDTRRMRVTADIRFDGGAIGALAWLTEGRLLALQEASSERQRLIAVDLARKRVVTRQALGGSVVRIARTARELVVLLAPAQAIGPARIALADRQGAVRFVRLDRILAGFKLLGTGSDHRVDARVPGLATDPQGRRAFVVGTSLVAEVDLTRLTVSYHALQRSASLLDRTPSSFEPAARAKQVSGYSRSARWLNGGLLAVSGADTEQATTRPVGLLAVDTRSWSVQTIDLRAVDFVAAGNLLLVTGERTGVTAYGFDGERRFHLLDDESVWLAQVYGGRAYVGISGKDVPLQIVDLTAGRVVGERRAPLPWLVKGVASGWW
jgi:hypothetical protein